MQLLRSEAQREVVAREAMLAAMASDPDAAARHIASVLDRRWLIDAGFFPLLNVALRLLATRPDVAEQLLLKAARHHPGVALHETEFYSALPFGVAIFEAAALAAPDEAVGLGVGTSATAHAVAGALRASVHPRLKVLAELLADQAAGVLVRERAAVFSAEIAAGRMSVSRALDIAAGGRYFSEVVKLRVVGDAADHPLYDRVLERTAQVLFRAMDGGAGAAPELRPLDARDLYLMLAYGRTEQDDQLFASIFDRLLLPKLRQSGPKGVTRLLDSLEDAHLRRFLSTAAAHRRLDAFLGAAGGASEQAEVLARCFRSIHRAAHPLDEALAASAVLDGIDRPERLRSIQSTLLAEYARAAAEQSTQRPPAYGLLAAALARRLPSGEPAFRDLAGRYLPYFHDPRVLDSSLLFNSSGTCVQQHFFYDDDDGEESFESFRRAYQGQRGWTWDPHGAFVVVRGAGPAGRRIEIYANVPDRRKLAAPRDNDSRHALSRMLAEGGLVPTVIVHRGHSFFVERTVPYLNNSARLVFLGSCRGLENVYAVMSAAARAQIVSTRAVGTQSVNDPLMKAINDELLAGAKTLDWERFWRTQEARFGHSATFRDYLPPHRNGPAILLSAYWECLAAL